MFLRFRVWLCFRCKSSGFVTVVHVFCFFSGLAIIELVYDVGFRVYGFGICQGLESTCIALFRVKGLG